jgi:NADP-dependent 3-hydroxy acid dehydrogenase YdfG
MSNNKVAIVTGASSGVGRATALSLAKAGFQVALLARRADRLDEIVSAAPMDLGKRLHPQPCDITNKSSVESTVQKLLEQFQRIDALINAAGTNIPDRSLAQLTDEKLKHVFDTNLTGALNLIQVVLPAMRNQKSGTIVNINSIAGQNASTLSGAAYVMSKFALRGLTQSINAEEAQHSIRATSIFPGDINTELLEKRPTIPPPQAREKMLQPQDIADCVLLAVTLPQRAVVEELRITPR